MRRITPLLMALALAGCNLNLMNSDPAQALNRAATTPTPSGSYPNPWYLFSDSLSTGDWLKGMAVWDAYWYVTVDFADGHALNGSKAMRVTFDNSNPTNPSPTWAEFVLIHTPDYSTFASTPGRNIAAAGYIKCRFSVRTSVNATVPFQLEGVSATNVACTPAWKEVTLSLPSPAGQTAFKTFFEINTPSVMPLDIYIDDLRYEP